MGNNPLGTQRQTDRQTDNRLTYLSLFEYLDLHTARARESVISSLFTFYDY